MTFTESLRSTAFHEAGHAVIAEYLTGFPAVVRLWPEAGRRRARGDCTHVVGTFDQQRLIALAGACAEVLAGDASGNSGDALLNPILHRISASDSANAGYYGRFEIDQCIVLCSRLWPLIDARARREISIFHEREAAGVAAFA